MPLFFYLEPEITDDPVLKNVKDITILYKFYLAKNQDLAEWIKQQQAWEFEQRAFLRNKRKQKKISQGESIEKLESEEMEDLVLMKESLPGFELGKSPNEITFKAMSTNSA